MTDFAKPAVPSEEAIAPDGRPVLVSVIEGRMEEQLAKALGVKQYPSFAAASFDELLEIVRDRAPPATAPSEEPVAWQCDECGGRTYALIDERQSDGHYKPGKDRRCVGCKKVHLASPAVAPVAVSVKAKDLKWRENPLGNFVAETIVGQYFVFKEDGVWNWVVVDISAWRNFPSPEAAKAAAQADFNARILSSIIPATKGGEDAIRRAWEYGRASWCPAGIVKNKERTERDWQEALAALSAQDTDGEAKS